VTREPTPTGAGARLGTFLATPRGKIIAGVAAVVLLAGCAVTAVTLTSSESAAPTTTTTSTTSSTTTTTVPPPPPPPVYPLTGLPVTDPAVAARPTLIVKIDNADPKSRPQAGINNADVVYEERVEGGVTRFMAIYHSHDAMPVGPVRSARTSDIGLFQPLYRPLFAWSGANAIFEQRIREAGIVDIGSPVAPQFYSRAGDRRAPHNLMLDSTIDVWAGSYPEATPPPSPLFAYRAVGEPPGPGGGPVTGVGIVFAHEPGSAPVDYAWNGAGWARWQSGTPHVDSEGNQIAPENVIVQYTPYANSDTNDQFGVPIREAQTVGEGEALVLTGGVAYTARWVKPAANAPTQFLDAAGAPIRLTPGRTWVELPEPGTTTIVP
jgi:Protein of unknown function (DUF3048) N-terminal domain/Protein of unknown function (DUF3048) C-terminal domain